MNSSFGLIYCCISEMFHCLILINCELAKLLAASTQIIMSEKKDKKKKPTQIIIFSTNVFLGELKPES